MIGLKCMEARSGILEENIQREHMVNRVSSFFPKGGHSATETEVKII